MSNEKYSFLDRGYPNPLRKTYDPVLDFRDMVVNMRNLQTHFNTKGGEQNLFDAIAEQLESSPVFAQLVDDVSEESIKFAGG